MCVSASFAINVEVIIISTLPAQADKRCQREDSASGARSRRRLPRESDVKAQVCAQAKTEATQDGFGARSARTMSSHV